MGVFILGQGQKGQVEIEGPGTCGGALRLWSGLVVVWSLAPILTALVLEVCVGSLAPFLTALVLEGHGGVLHPAAMSYIIPRSKVCSISIHTTN